VGNDCTKSQVQEDTPLLPPMQTLLALTACGVRPSGAAGWRRADPADRYAAGCPLCSPLQAAVIRASAHARQPPARCAQGAARGRDFARYAAAALTSFCLALQLDDCNKVKSQTLGFGSGACLCEVRRGRVDQLLALQLGGRQALLAQRLELALAALAPPRRIGLRAGGGGAVGAGPAGLPPTPPG